MIKRDLHGPLTELATHYPTLLVTGPRQSGKTTLCRAAFSDKAYVSLEPLDFRQAAQEDPRGFLEEYRAGAVIDEVQHVPGLLSYLQDDVDRDPTPGRFVLTGSQHFGLLEAVTQSLAGRCGILTLLPPSHSELLRFPTPPETLLDTLWQGAFPRIHDRRIPANRWLNDYVTTYIQRDVRQVTQITDLGRFNQFVKLCAGRTAQEINRSSLGGDAGITHNTVGSWLSVLEGSYLALQLPAWHNNIRKQLIKAPKLHITDSGLVCALLGIQDAEQLRHHPLRGAIFESWVVLELYKQRLNRGQLPAFYHYREARGLEIDLIIEEAADLLAIEIKSGATIASDFFNGLIRFRETFTNNHRTVRAALVYGGEDTHRRHDIDIWPWKQVDRAGIWGDQF